MQPSPPQQLELPAAGGRHRLAASVFSPVAPPRAAVLLAGAMGVPRQFYQPFAQHLAERGFATLTLDYRGIGGSAPATLRGFEATVHGWAEEDLSGALELLEQQYPGVPVLYVGHSIGGQLLALIPRIEQRVSAALLVASQSGYWRLWPGAGKYAMWLLWNAAIPLFTRTLGYLPMGRLGQGEDLPAGVAREWARWGMHPRYLYSYAEEKGGLGFTRFDRPLRSYALSDDAYAPEPTVRALLAFYTATSSEFRLLEPHHGGAKRIGHFGFFRSRFRDTLWTEAVQWLEAQLSSGAIGSKNSAQAR